MASADQISCRNLGRQSWASAPTGRKGGPINHLGQRSVCVSGRKGWVWGAAEIIPKVSSNLGQSLSQPAADGSLCTREPWGTGVTDCHVALLLAMTVLILCHSEEAQRADVGIRPFYDGRGFGPPGRRPLRKGGIAAATTQASRRATKRPRQRPRGMGGNRRKDHPKRGTAAATAQAALSEAESAERAAGQIQVLPDDLFVQHGVPGSVAC